MSSGRAPGAGVEIRIHRLTPGRERRPNSLSDSRLFHGESNVVMNTARRFGRRFSVWPWKTFAGNPQCLHNAVGATEITRNDKRPDAGHPEFTPASRVELVSFGGKCRSEEHTSELQSQSNLVCRLLL